MAKPNTILITGASRGLGLEFARQYAADGWHVIATCRAPERAAALKKLARTHGNISIFQLDVTDAKSITRLARTLAKTPIDVLLNNSGTAGKGAWGASKDQVFGHHNYKVWEEVWRTNTLGPLRMAEALITNVKKSKIKKIINISSMGGSIKTKKPAEILYFTCDAYLMSKTALNMTMRATAFQLMKDKVIVVNMCPGWVRTEMGGPKAPLSPTESVTALRKTITKLTLKDTGRFIDRNGKNITW